MQRSGKILAVLSLPSTLPHMVQSSFRWRAIVFFDSSSVSLPPFCVCFWLFSNAFMYSQSFYLWFRIWDLTYSLHFICNSEISTLQFQRCLQYSRNYSLGPMVLATNKQAIFSLFFFFGKIYLFQRESMHTQVEGAKGESLHLAQGPTWDMISQPWDHDCKITIQAETKSQDVQSAVPPRCPNT